MEATNREEKPITHEEMLARIEEQTPETGKKLRMLLDKRGFLQDRNVYGELYADRQIGICFDAIFRAEYLRCRILETIRDEARSVKQIAELLGKTPREVLYEVVELRRKNLLALERVDDRTPYYRAA